MKYKPGPVKQKGPNHTTKLQLKEDNRLLSMSVQADEDHFGESEEDDGGDEPLLPLSQQSEDSDNESHSTTDSVKILPMSAADKQKQIDNIDHEVAGKLQELHSLMSEGGLNESVRFLEENFGLGRGDKPNDGATAGNTSKSPKRRSVGARAPNLDMADLTGRRQYVEHHVQFSGQNVNFNHKPVSYPIEGSRSVETIYRNAVQKRRSSSSDECIDMGDESIDLFPDADFQPDYEDEPMEMGEMEQQPDREPSQEPEYEPDEPQPCTSRGLERILTEKPVFFPLRKQTTPEEDAMKNVVEAANAKAAIFPNTGIPNFTAKIDEDYLVVGAHIDDSTRAKIIKGEYVDFGKLLPRDKILAEEDGRLELVVKNGRTYWLPVSESVSINGFS